MPNNDIDLLSFVSSCKKSGRDYRNSFKGTWDECEQQIRCVLPEYFNSKEDWQTKIFIPMQAKKSEIACSYLNKMIFGKQRFFDINGNESFDDDSAEQLAVLMQILLNIGGFYRDNKFVINEAVDLGTGIIKITMSMDGFPKFTWRSVYNVLLDPACGHDINKARFVIDQFEKDVSWLQEEYKKDKSIYRKDVLKQFMDDAEAEARQARGNNSYNSQDLKESFAVVKSIDGTNNVEIPAKYKTVSIDECWCLYPDSKGVYKHKVISVLNDKYILRDDDNTFGFIPFQWCRIKPRKYDSYGRGYIENTRGLQDLQNTCVNLAFDSLKISSMDIVVVDDSKIKDPTSIKYKPLAIWKMKDVNGVKIQRNQSSSVVDVLRGITLIDQIDQDASGVTRQAQGAPNLSGGGTSSETLGEYQLKLQAIDQRFLDVGRFIEVDYVVPLLCKLFKIIRNKELFDQAKIDRLIGQRTEERTEVTQTMQEDPMLGQQTVPSVNTVSIQVPKLKFDDLAKIEEMEIDFKPVGVTNFTDQMEVIEKLRTALELALSNPMLTNLTKIDELWKKIWQVSDIPDYAELLKSKDDILKEQQAAEPAGMPGGMPMPGQPAGTNPMQAMMGANG
jgi:hypothetical protein